MIVLKFGGTSVGSPDRIRSVAHLAACIPGHKTLVLSAMTDATNDLVTLTQLITSGERDRATRHVEMLRSRYIDNVVPELFAGHELHQQLAEEVLTPILDSLLLQTLNEAFTHNDEKQILARGEMMCTAPVALTLQLYEEITPHKLLALDFMRVTHEGRPDIGYTAQRLHPMVGGVRDVGALFLTKGYICRNAFGEMDNLRCGESDYSATLIGGAVQAEEIQIWTDIDGLHNNGPRMVNMTSSVRRLNFGEAVELTRCGAEILHPACIESTRRAGIPVRLLNTLDPSVPGVLMSYVTNRDMIKAISAEDGMCVVTLLLKHLSNSDVSMGQFLITLTEATHRLHIEPDISMASGDGYVIVTEEDSGAIDTLTKEMTPWAEGSVQSDLSILVIVGDMGWHRVDFEARILEAVDDATVWPIYYGTSSNSIDLVIATEEKRRAMVYLSDHLFAHLRTPGPGVP